MDNEKFISLEDIGAYRIAFSISNYIWDTVLRWSYFEKRTIGIQLVRAADSISANLAEGFGRYNKKEKIFFYRISFGSLRETIDWIDKSIDRQLISDKDYKHIKSELNKLPKEINFLIKYTNEKLRI